jgi:CBS domain-containing protein
MSVNQVMTRNPETIRARDLLAVADERMQRGRFGRLPVVDPAGTLVGILTRSDLRQHAGYLATTHVDAAMTETPVTITADQSIRAAAELMLRHQIEGLPVLDEEARLIGIITRSDLLRVLLDRDSAATSS